MSQLPKPKRPWPKDEFGTPEDLQAAGTVIAAWNLCEHAFVDLLLQVLKIDYRLNARILNLLSDPNKIKLLVLEARDRLTPEEFARVDVFVKHMDICRESRNLIAHASYNRNAIAGGLSLSKAPGRDGVKSNTFLVSTAKMWELAETIYSLAQWGFRLSYAIMAGPQRIIKSGDLLIPMPLPDIPPQPRKLDPE